MDSKLKIRHTADFLDFSYISIFANANRHTAVCLFAAVRTLYSGFSSSATQIKKPPDGGEHFARHVSHACAQICTYSNCASLVFIYKFSGGRAGTRTLDPLIKSQLLYQLSYASRTINCGNYISFYRFCKYLFTTANMTQDYTPWFPCEFQSAIADDLPCLSHQLCRFFVRPKRVRHGAPTLNPYAHIPSSTHQNVE